MPELPLRPEAKYFEVHFRHELEGEANGGEELVFRVATNAPRQASPKILAMKSELEATVHKVISLVQVEARRETYIYELGLLGRIVLEDGDFDIAREALDSFYSKFILDEGVIIRRNYIFSIIRWSTFLGLPSLLIAGGITLLTKFDLSSQVWLSGALPYLSYVSTGGWIVFGVALGACLASFVRSRQLSFKDLGYFDADLFDPGLRFFFLLLVSLIVSILLANKWLIVGLTDSLQLNNFIDSPSISIILGLLTGFAEPNVTRMVTTTLESIKDRTGKD